MSDSSSQLPYLPPAGVEQWADTAFQALQKLSGVTRVGLALIEGGGRRFLFATRDQDQADAVWRHIDTYEDMPINDALGSGTKIVDAVSDLAERYEPFAAQLRRAGVEALAAVPLKEDRRVLGGFVLYYAKAQNFDPRQSDELDALADDLAARLYAALHRPGPSLPDYTPPHGSRIAAEEFPADLHSVSHARHFLRTTLTEWEVDQDVTDKAGLGLSELVTNAIVHAHSGCCVQIELYEQVLRIEVHDLGSGVPWRKTGTLDPDNTSGRGLAVVDALADRWGQIDGPDRAVVWFAIDVP